jgi:arylsulfatase A-like enzyme
MRWLPGFPAFLAAASVLVAGAEAHSQPLNFIVVMSDDQAFPTMQDGAMPNLDAWADQGIRFERAYVSYPICAPVRASFLSGGFEPRETGVTWNVAPQGGATRFNDSNSLGTQFQAAGYATAHVGKYINDYNSIRPYVPPGWTLFVENTDVGSSDQNPSVATPVPERDPHRLYHYREYALDFLDAHAQDPFLLILSVTDPHHPATPAPGDENLFTEFLYRPPGYGEPDLSDKPPLIQAMAPNQCCHPNFGTVAAADEFHRDQLRSLVGLDRVIESLRQKLVDLAVLDRTVFFFFGDNGLLRGEHQHYSKDYAYEESLGVPMIVIAPGNVPRNDPNLVVANLDIPATLFDLAGIGAETDGQSLAPLLPDPNAPWRTELTADFAFRPFYWAALVTENWKYVEWGDGSVELYDLQADPYELESRHADPAYAPVLQDLAARREGYARTLAIRQPFFNGLPVARTDERYSHTLSVWGGTPPYRFSLESGSLPMGISLNPAKGRLHGVPRLPEDYGENVFSVRVSDSSVTKHHGGPQIAVKDLSFRILPEPSQVEGLLACVVLLRVLEKVRRRGASPTRRPLASL